MVWSTPKLIKWKYDNGHYFLVGSGYDTYFDNDSEVPVNYHKNRYGLLGYSTSRVNFPYYDFVIENDSLYPVTAPPAPYLFDIDPYDEDNLERYYDDIVEADSIYLVDIVGNLYMHFDTTGSGDFETKHVLELPQDKSSVDNEEILKSLSGPMVKIRNDPSESGKRQVWVYYGTGDLTRPLTVQVDNNKIIGMIHYRYESENPNQSEASSFTKMTLNGTDFYDATNDKNFDTINPDEFNVKEVSDSELGGDGTVGWYINLPDRTMLVGEPIFYNNRVYFTTYTINEPDAAPSGNLCEHPGSGYSQVWEVNAFNGRPVGDNTIDTSNNDDRIVANAGTDISFAPILIKNEDNVMLIIGSPDGYIDVLDIEDEDFSTIGIKLLWWKIY